MRRNDGRWRGLRELLEFIVVKLSSVVRDNDLGNSKLTDDVIPYEILGVPFCYLSERLRFYPLRKVINGDDQEFSL